MSVRYKLVSRQDFSKGAEKGSTKFYAQALSNGNATTNEICESVSEESALSSGDVKSFLDRIVRKLVTAWSLPVQDRILKKDSMLLP